MSLLNTTHRAVASRVDTLQTGEHVSVAIPDDLLKSFLEEVETRYGDDVSITTRSVASETTQVKITLA